MKHTPREPAVLAGEEAMNPSSWKPSQWPLWPSRQLAWMAQATTETVVELPVGGHVMAVLVATHYATGETKLAIHPRPGLDWRTM